jgi:thiamine-monophosphate kinase
LTTPAQTVADIGEDALVSLITKGLAPGEGVITGAGDDCAVLMPNRRGEVTLLKTDCVVQDVHFTKATPAALVGRKAIARVISDIAAMGGEPQHAVITLVLPPDTGLEYVEQLYAGMNKVAADHGVGIVGGETSRGPVLMISVSMTGKAQRNRWISRAGAKVGDLIFVTGKLGGSLSGRHLTFEPRLKEGLWLAQNFRIHAMMDLSDGLAKDLPRLAAASSVGFVLDEKSVPVKEGCTVQQACGDGEDFELLFTVASRSAGKLTRLWTQNFPELPLTCIGRIASLAEGHKGLPGHSGWDHFQ